MATLKEVDVSGQGGISVKPVDDVTPRMRYTLAIWVIGGMALAMIAAAANYQVHTGPEAAGIWSFAKAGVFPLLASVIGYYFRSARE